MNGNGLKIGGVAAIVVGSAALYFSGTGVSVITAIAGAVFVLAGIIASLFKGPDAPKTP